MGRLLVLVLAWLAACGGEGAVGDAAAARDASVFVGECSWPTQYDTPDGGPLRACAATRYALVCTDSSSGDMEYCGSAEKDACPADPGGVSGPTVTCVSQCADGEFAVTCSSNPALDGEAPSGCRTAAITPGGVFYCCACGEGTQS